MRLRAIDVFIVPLGPPTTMTCPRGIPPSSASSNPSIAWWIRSPPLRGRPESASTRDSSSRMWALRESISSRSRVSLGLNGRADRVSSTPFRLPRIAFEWKILPHGRLSLSAPGSTAPTRENQPPPAAQKAKEEAVRAPSVYDDVPEDLWAASTREKKPEPER